MENGEGGYAAPLPGAFLVAREVGRGAPAETATQGLRTVSLNLESTTTWRSKGHNMKTYSYEYLQSSRRNRATKWLGFEALENRSLLSVDFSGLAADLGAKLTKLQNQILTIDAKNGLPVANEPLASIPAVMSLVSGFENSLTSAVKSLPTDKPTVDQVKQALLATLGPNNAGVVSGLNDISVNIKTDTSGSATDVDFALHLHQNVTTAVPYQTLFGLGLPGIPLNLTGPNDAAVKLGFDYANLNFGIHNSKQFYFDSSKPNVLTISVNGAIPNATEQSPMNGTLGFLPVTVADDPTSATNFQGVFAVNVDDQGQLGTPSLSGEADVHLAINSLSVPGVPQLSTTLNMTWPFAQSNPNGKPTEFGSPPAVSFDNIRVDVQANLSSFVEQDLNQFATLIAPLQPIINAFNAPLPILSGVTPLTLLNDVDPTLGSLVELATDVNTLTNDIPGASGALNHFQLDLGSFKLTGNGDLRALPQIDYKNAAQNLSKLVGTGLKSLTIQNVEDQIVQNLQSSGTDPKTIQSVKSIFDFFNPATQPAGLQFTLTFPLFDNAGAFVANLISGQAMDLVRFDAKVQDHRDISVGPLFLPFLPLGIGAGFSGSLDIDGSLGIGYDTKGLLEFVEQSIATKALPPTGLLGDGLYVSDDSHLSIQGSVNGSIVVLGPFAQGAASGGLVANMNLVAVDSVVNDGKRRVLQPADNAPGEFLFATSGGIAGELSGSVFTEVFVVLGFVLVPFNYDSGLVKLLDLDGGGIGNPFDTSQVQLADLVAAKPGNETVVADPGGKRNEFVVTDPSGLLVLNVGPDANRRNFNPNEVNEDFEVSPDTPRPSDPAGEAVIVSAFGFQQRYAGVKAISADGASGDDVVSIDPGIHARVALLGGLGNDQLSSMSSGDTTLDGGDGNDTLTGGPGKNHLIGGEGDDQLTGGAGPNTLDGGDGNDTIKGGAGPNQITGGAGNDEIFAGPGNDVLDGGDGDDTLTGGAGTEQIQGGNGNDTILWTVGDGSATIDGGAGGKDALTIYGSPSDEVFHLAASGSAVVAIVPGATLTVSRVERIDVEAEEGADPITADDLDSAGVTEVDANLLQVVKPDASLDEITINGSPLADTIQVKTESVQIGVGNPTAGAPPTLVAGGITDVLRERFVARVANSKDHLTVNGLAGADQFQISSETGPTTVNGGDENDAFTVVVTKPTDHLGPLVLDGGPGANALLIDESASALADNVQWTGSGVISTLLPRGVSYQASGGFGGGLGLTTGLMADTVNVRSTLAGAVTTVHTGAGDDTVNVSSTDQQLTGDLADIRGLLAIDEGTGNNRLAVSDEAATSGNQNVLITASAIKGLAGPADNVDLTYKATGGTFGSIEVDGSNAPGLAESFKVSSTGGPLSLYTHDGPDFVRVQSLSGHTLIDAGPGNDRVVVETTSQSTYDLTVDGGPQPSTTGGDVLGVTDAASGAVVHDHAMGNGSGHVDVFYRVGLPSHIAYMGMERVVPSVDANTSFVQAIYHTILNQDATAAELSAGVAKLAAGTTRIQLADQVERSKAALAKRVSGWFVTYFKKKPTAQQLASVVAQLKTHTEEVTLANLFQHYVPKPATNAAVAAFVTNVFQKFLNRLPTSNELSAGKQSVHKHGVDSYMRVLFQSSQYRQTVVAGYFVSLLRRPKPPALNDPAVQSLIVGNNDLRTIRETMEGSQEFFDNAY
jgi:Ca2+-binding RTX toxin-like protein